MLYCNKICKKYYNIFYYIAFKLLILVFIFYCQNCAFFFRCNERIQLYTCPRCNIGYCGVECYKSDVHTDCSESFYEQCVKDELKAQENDPTVRQKMVEILKRVHDADLDVDLKDSEDESSDEGDFTLDSDDEQEVNENDSSKI